MSQTKTLCTIKLVDCLMTELNFSCELVETWTELIIMITWLTDCSCAWSCFYWRSWKYAQTLWQSKLTMASSSVFVLVSSSPWQQNSDQRSSIMRRTTSAKKSVKILDLEREYRAAWIDFYSKLSNWIWDWGGGWCMWYWYVCCALGKPPNTTCQLVVEVSRKPPLEKESQEWDGLV